MKIIQQNNKAVTLVELLVVLIVSAIVLLTIGAISEVGPKSYEKNRKEAQAYNDIMYGFEEIKHKVHHAYDMHAENWNPINNAWPQPVLVINYINPVNDQDECVAFAKYIQDGPVEFVMVPGCDKSGVKKRIFEKANTLDFSFTIDPSEKFVAVTVSGEKIVTGTGDKERFSLSTKAMRRN